MFQSEVKVSLRLAAITCEIFYREICYLAAQSPHVITLHFVRKGLHEVPAQMRQVVQELIDGIKPDQADAILLVFGLCGNVVDGLTARHVPLIIPRAHDCITLFLGSRERYQEEFSANPGTYYYTSASFERNRPDEKRASLGAADDEETINARYAQYVAQFGEDNARYLIELEKSWLNNYSRVVYLTAPPFDLPHLREKVEERAAAHKLPLVELPADYSLLKMLCDGDWPDDKFLTVPPGHMIKASHDDGIIKAVPISPPGDRQTRQAG